MRVLFLNSQAAIATTLDFVEEPMSQLVIDPRKTALVAIDLQNAVLRMNSVPHATAKVVSNNRRISDVLRAKGGMVVWVRVDINQAIRLPVDIPMPFEGKHLPSELMEIAPSAGLQDGDLLITKYHWGGFAGTPLEQQLRARDIDTIILTGISTNAGVESTLRQGTGLGFAFIVAEDACSGRDADEHRFAFQNIFPRLARVRSVDEVLKVLA
jgi:nicotinamidase-related amidase